jgi:hypothetical protein
LPIGVEQQLPPTGFKKTKADKREKKMPHKVILVLQPTGIT